MLLKQKGTPSRAAARARQISPSGCSTPLPPVGAITSGAAHSCSNNWTRWWRPTVFTSVSGTNGNASKAIRLRRRLTSSSAPPSRYSKTKPGIRLRAISRRSAMLSARESLGLGDSRRCQGMLILVEIDPISGERAGRRVVVADGYELLQRIRTVERRDHLGDEAAERVEFLDAGS